MDFNEVLRVLHKKEKIVAALWTLVARILLLVSRQKQMFLPFTHESLVKELRYQKT